MKRTFSILFFVFFCQILVFAQPELKAKFDKLLEEDFLKTSEVGISVYDLTDGKSLYTYQENKLYRPASIQKLITAITGLSVLGPDHFFSTTFYHTGEIRNGVLNGPKEAGISPPAISLSLPPIYFMEPIFMAYTLTMPYPRKKTLPSGIKITRH